MQAPVRHRDGAAGHDSIHRHWTGSGRSRRTGQDCLASDGSGPQLAPPGIEETKRPGHGGRKTKDAPVAVAIEQGVVGLEQEGAAPLGEEVVAGHVGAPVAEHFGHVPQAHRG